MQYTDRFGSPLSVGDKIVVAISNGRSSAELKETEILDIIPLIPHRDKTEPKYAYDYQAKSYTTDILGYYYMREDQQGKAGPTEFYRPKDTPADKLFVIRYQNYGYDYSVPFQRGQERPIVATKAQSFDRVMDLVRVPDGV